MDNCNAAELADQDAEAFIACGGLWALIMDPYYNLTEAEMRDLVEDVPSILDDSGEGRYVGVRDRHHLLAFLNNLPGLQDHAKPSRIIVECDLGPRTQALLNGAKWSYNYYGPEALAFHRFALETGVVIPFRFLELPSELRNMVYEAALPTNPDSMVAL
ncbi:hypothetical protein LTR56_026969 [Elasticomyces elasticus]|nr:hypothetical protein LTR56_026969 [Elasticomyces elasticus]KAK3615465.1 hypothetical protein LTR22_027430 [Elasticomyces elasticus]KAK4901928.1 hypothetical protein LTR49_027154 [Elasticomyces elasticus]